MRYTSTLFVSALFFMQSVSLAEDAPEVHNDPHYNEMGFFDIHICNWPERPNFFKVIFSSQEYKKIDTIKVYMPDDTLLVELDKKKFRTLKRKNKADKRVFILDIDVPESASTGWYKVDVKTNDGKMYQARDFVIMTRLEQVSRMQPSGDSKEYALPITLKWAPVTGSQFYRVFVRDVWAGRLVYKSKLLSGSEIQVPDHNLESGGYYSWSVHARDTNEHVLLGDFHMGSISKKSFFTVSE